MRPLVRFDGESLLTFFGDPDHSDSSARVEDALALGQDLWNFRCIKELKREAHEHIVHTAVGIRKVRGVAARQLDSVDQMFFLHSLSRPCSHSFREVNTEYLAFLADGFRQLNQAVAGSVANLKNTIPSHRGKFVEASLTDRPFAVFG